LIQFSKLPYPSGKKNMKRKVGLIVGLWNRGMGISARGLE